MVLVVESNDQDPYPQPERCPACGEWTLPDMVRCSTCGHNRRGQRWTA